MRRRPTTVDSNITRPCLAALASLVATFASGCADGPPRISACPDCPAVTEWIPVGARTVGDYGYDVIPQPDAFHTMHSSVNNSDNVWIAVAPMMEMAWVAEPAFYVGEGPTFDNQGNLYFSPLYPREDVSLVSLDANTGERNWALPGDGYNGGGGAPLVLNDPDTPGRQVIYNGTYESIVAVRPDGTIVWQEATGLTLPPLMEGVRSDAHIFGVNYHPQSDAVIGLTIRGQLYAHDRRTGEAIARVAQVPGAPAAIVDHGLPSLIIRLSNRVSDEAFGPTPDGLSVFEAVLNAVFGGGSVVANYFGIDPNTGRIYVAATAEDDADGTSDGVSELGALYVLELNETTAGWEFELVGETTFVGGTGSTPTISEDGTRLFVSDNLGNVICLRASDLEEIWRIDVGAQLVASVAVSPDNAEVYAVTRYDVFKIVDRGDHATLAWAATLDAFADDPSITIEANALSPSIAANGIAISIGGGTVLAGNEVFTQLGVGLLDRETGRLRGFAVGREESISVTAIAPNGGVCTGNSPVRRFGAVAVDPENAAPIVGGITCYRPVHNEVLARDAICAAGARAENAASIRDAAPASAREDLLQIEMLVSQTRAALSLAVREGTINRAFRSAVGVHLSNIEASLDLAGLETIGVEAEAACVMLSTRP